MDVAHKGGPLHVHLVALLTATGLLSDTSDDVFVSMLVGMAKQSSVHDAIVLLSDCIVCTPLTVTWTADFVSIWKGVHSVRRTCISRDTWDELMRGITHLVAAGLCTQANTDDGDEYTLTPDPCGRLYDTACISDVPWRLLVFRGLIGALARVGHAHRHTRVSILQGVQAAARRLCTRMQSDELAARTFPADRHRDVLENVMEALPMMLAYGWQDTDTPLQLAVPGTPE
jgi:hypothetical protein